MILDRFGGLTMPSLVRGSGGGLLRRDSGLGKDAGCCCEAIPSDCGGLVYARACYAEWAAFDSDANFITYMRTLDWDLTFSGFTNGYAGCPASLLNGTRFFDGNSDVLYGLVGDPRFILWTGGAPITYDCQGNSQFFGLTWQASLYCDDGVCHWNAGIQFFHEYLDPSVPDRRGATYAKDMTAAGSFGPGFSVTLPLISENLIVTGHSDTVGGTCTMALH